MGKTTGFLEYQRINGPVIPPEKRVLNFNEFHASLPPEQQQLQGARCMACGVPFCQSGSTIAGMPSGCPLHNLLPETNDLVYRGLWEQAYRRLSITHGLPEFTSRVCTALCERACTCGVHNEPISTKENERSIIEYAFAHGLVEEPVPAVRTGKRIAVIGSGPSGLSCAQMLNRRGHSVTVFERSDRPGGLLRYGIPNMELDKRVIDRRVDLLKKAGIEFRCGVNVGVDITGAELMEQYDRVVLCCGSSNPRDLKNPGRDAKGIYFAVDFLSEVSRKLMDLNYDSDALIASTDFSFGSLKGKNVIIVGGGDTGTDCLGTCIRLGAASAAQLEMMPMPPEERDPSNPWPEWPNVLKTGYGQEEAIALYGSDPRIYQTTITEFLKDEAGSLRAVRTVHLKPERDKKTGRVKMVPEAGTEKELPADLVLIAAGFLGSEAYIRDTFGVECNQWTNVKTADGSYQTTKDRVFTAGDMHRGQSLVVWAIAEGRQAARAVDESLMGYSNL